MSTPSLPYDPTSGGTIKTSTFDTAYLTSGGTQLGTLYAYTFNAMQAFQWSKRVLACISVPLVIYLIYILKYFAWTIFATFGIDLTAPLYYYNDNQ